MSSSYKVIKGFSNTEKANNYSCNDNSSEILRKMFDFFEDQKFCDITLISSDKNIKIKAHRNILAASSEYFLLMFTGSLKEAEAAEVQLNQLDGQTLKMVITCMYTNIIQLQSDTVESILKAGHLFQFKALEITCCDFMKNQLEPSNCLGIALFAEQYNYMTLCEDAVAFQLKNFMKVRDCEEFLMLEIDQLKRLLSNDDLRVKSEEEVFHSVMSWIKYDQLNREKHITQLDQCIRFQLIHPGLIANAIEEAFDSIAWREMIHSAYKWHSLHAFQYSFQPNEVTKLRSLDDVVIAVSGWNNPTGCLNVGYYYSGSDDWIYTGWPGMSEQRVGFASARVGDKLIIAGGRVPSGEPSTRVDCLDLRTLKWTILTSMTAARYCPKMVTLNGALYVFGGRSETGNCFAEKLDSLQSSEWKSLPNIKSSNSFCVAVKGNLLHIEDVTNKRSYEYNPEGDTLVFTSLPNLILPIGMVTMYVNEIAYSIKVYKNNIKKLDINDNIITDIAVNLQFATNCAKFGDQLIVYGQNEFKIYTESGLVAMPYLSNGVGDVILLSN